MDYQRKGFNDDDKREEINGIMTKSTTLLVSLIEGNDVQEIR